MSKISGWTDERKLRARTMWLAGIAAKRIAASLDCGLSPNAIIGMMQRMAKDGAERAAKPPKPVAPPKPPVNRSTPRSTKRAIWAPADIAPAARPGPAMSVVPEPVMPALREDGPVALFDLAARDCRRPLWGHLERPALSAMRFCGARTPEGSSWCRACQAIVYSGRAA